MSKQRTRAELLEAVEAKIASCQKDLDTFQERFNSNPAYAFEWSPLEAAGMMGPLMAVANGCRRELDEGETEEQAYEHLRDFIQYQAMSFADRVQRSTSQPTNLIKDYERVQWVKLMKFANGEPLGWL